MSQQKPQQSQPSENGKNGKDHFEGVFSREESFWIGTGATRRKTVNTMYYFAESRDDGQVSLRALNARHLPSGDELVMELDDFLSAFRPEPEIYHEKTIPALRQLSKSLAKAERLRGTGQPYGAEMAYKDALNLDADNVRGNFGLGLTYLDQGKKQEAEGVLKHIVKLEGSFEAENKHMFNEFGIKLRKSKMYEQALAYYATAYKVAKRDEHLCYNIARTLYDKGDLKTCQRYLEKALALRPDFEEAAKMLTRVAQLQSKAQS